MGKYEVYITKAKQLNDERYWNNYQWLNDHSEDPFMGWYFRSRMKRLESEENERYWNDYFRNTGIDRSRVSYPIRSGLYRVQSPGAETFEASKAVMSLYGNIWKWLR